MAQNTTALLAVTPRLGQSHCWDDSTKIFRCQRDVQSMLLVSGTGAWQLVCCLTSSGTVEHQIGFIVDLEDSWAYEDGVQL